MNSAYYVYNGVPAYQAFGPEVLQALPVYSLITRALDLDQCTAWFPPFNNSTDQLPTSTDGRYHFNWEGAIVYDGEVYDHVRYRLRGANGRYHPGKRSFRFKFNDGRNQSLHPQGNPHHRVGAGCCPWFSKEATPDYGARSFVTRAVRPPRFK